MKQRKLPSFYLLHCNKCRRKEEHALVESTRNDRERRWICKLCNTERKILNAKYFKERQ